ncbi:hypothetical protein [Photorhabdus akhurstii]|uniref:hypothetical protein n=1 Tax=Photorhabdus akhurstii TaxID=171438 RepID=UPI0037044932
MSTIAFVKYAKKKLDVLEFSKPELRHESRLTVTWKSEKIWSREVLPDTFSGGYSHIVSWPDASMCITVADEIIKKHSDYYESENFALLLLVRTFWSRPHDELEYIYQHWCFENHLDFVLQHLVSTKLIKKPYQSSCINNISYNILLNTTPTEI